MLALDEVPCYGRAKDINVDNNSLNLLNQQLQLFGKNINVDHLNLDTQRLLKKFVHNDLPVAGLIRN